MAQLQYILNRLPIGMIMLDRDGNVVSFSGLAVSLFGQDALSGALGKHIDDLHPPAAREKIGWMMRQAEDEGASGFSSMLINMPNKVLQLRMILMRGADGISGYCMTFYDITELTTGPDQAEATAGGVERPLFRLPVSTGGRIALLDVDLVSFLKADGHYARVFAEGKVHFCNLSLSQLEARLPADRFVRVHRSYLINVGRARAVQYRDDQYVITVDGAGEDEVPVGRRHVQRVRSLLGF